MQCQHLLASSSALAIRALCLTWVLCISRGCFWCLCTSCILCLSSTFWGLLLGGVQSLHVVINEIQELLALSEGIVKLFDLEDLLSWCLAWLAMWLI